MTTSAIPVAEPRRSMPPQSLDFTWVTSDRDLELLRDAWTRLDDGARPGAVFRSWEWQATWWRTLGSTPGRRLAILVGRDATGPRGILPLCIDDAPVARLVPRRRLRFLADDTVGSDYLGLIAPAADHAALAARFAERVASDPGLADADLAQLHDLSDVDPLADILAESFRSAGWARVHTVPRYRCPLARIRPSLEDYLASRPNHFGRQIARKHAELMRQPGFDLRILDRPDEVAASFDALFALHRARWQEDGGSAAFTSPQIEEFHRRSGHLLAERGLTRVGLLTMRGEPVAAAYGFQRGARLDYYQSGMLPEWRRRSVGMVVLVELIRRAHAEGVNEIDFLRGEEPYKGFWATEIRTTHTLVAQRGTVRGRVAAGAQALVAGLRRVARERLPAPALRTLRRIAAGMART
jgi:CelD/BcsL family acetyltransferase involved in cellulose biosynthesis